MKVIKLIFIFIAVLGTVIGVVFLSKGDNGPIEGKYAGYYAKAEKKINSEWKSDAEWLWAHFEDTKNYLEVRNKKLKGGYKTLVDLFHQRACHCLYNNSIAEFAKHNCNKTIVDTLKSDLDKLIQAAPEQKDSAQTTTLYNVHDLYGKAYSLATQKSFGLTPDFDKYRGTWKDYNAYRTEQETRRSNIQKDSLFSYIKDISEIVDGLNSMDTKLNEGKERFKSSLVKEIINEYKSDEPIVPTSIDSEKMNEAKKWLENYEEAYKKLRGARDKYKREFDESKTLSDFVRKFKDAVDTYRNRIEDAEKRALEERQNTFEKSY